MKKTMIAMILVGGRGTRLGDITSETAKPAVSFGAKYRLIDFTLSNLTNSNIDTCGIVTQYEPFDLMYYIGSGRSWDLDIIDGGIRFLTPYARKDNILWQKGTAHAVKQYFNFITSYNASYVLILSGDHIYKMDYQEMLKHHISNKAEVTIAANYVDLKDASRFGIIEVDKLNHAVGFEEKPDKPKTNLASMGIYIFSVDALEEILKKASDDDIDFGKNIIPKAIKSEKVVSVFRFDGYWRDVGTVKSLYDANMDLLDDSDFLDLNISKNLPVYSKSLNLNPHVMLEKAKATKSLIADGCLINGEVIHSTVAYSSVIESGSKIINSVILPRVTIGHDCFLQNVIVNKDIVIPDNYRCESLDLTLITETNMFEVGGIYD
ncbi:MAG: NTP transferase domain-containing protein [Tenericutes bacterium]|nr:NTP transferase domain-containing protein [Mycoplasmatota bacterium]